MTTSDFSIGDAVQHTHKDAPIGVVVSLDHARGLVRVKWESRVQEWVPPKELHALRPTG